MKKKITSFSIFVTFLFNIVMRNCSSKTAHYELRIRHNELLLVSSLCQCGAVVIFTITTRFGLKRKYKETLFRSVKIQIIVLQAM